MSFQSSGSFFRDVERELLSKYGFTRVDLFFDVLQESVRLVVSRDGVTMAFEYPAGALRVGQVDLCGIIDQTMRAAAKGTPPPRPASSDKRALFYWHRDRVTKLKLAFRADVPVWNGDPAFKYACRAVSGKVPVGYGGPFHSEDGRFNMMASMVHRKGRPMSHAEAVAFYYPHGRPRYRPRPVLEDMEDACRYAFGSFTVRRPPSATEVSVGSYSDREWTL